MSKIHLKRFDFTPEKEYIVEKKRRNTDISFLYVYNDNFNTFEHVIETLMRICGHTEEQAQQCTILIHFKGKCSVKRGATKDLMPMKEGIIAAGIQASIV